MSVLLLNMPFSNLRWPNLGLSLLKSGLTSQGIPCEIRSPCFDFAERIGLDLYTWIAEAFAFVNGGDYLFGKDYFGDRIPPLGQFWNDVVLWTEPLTDEDFGDYRRVASHVGNFLDDYADSIDWNRYEIVGFSLMFQQTFASLGLARRIKEKNPAISILFGGAACEADMGVAIFEQFSEIDYVFLGEADANLPVVVRNILDRKSGFPLPEGVLGRESLAPLPQVRTGNSKRRAGTTCPARVDLDTLPFPDFDDYFARLAASPLRNEIHPLLFFETSRGCWWGQHHPCSFCGLNGADLAYRLKSAPRAVEELRYLCERYGITEAAAADNIFAREYFDSFLPLLREAGLDLRFEYEMKSNLVKSQCEQLLASGLAAAQIGIETLSTPLLKLLGKGALARHNLQVLKWFTAAGIEVKWNFLYGIPGEDPGEYVKLAELVPKLLHLAAPLAVGRVRIDRFGRYFEHPEECGIGEIRPHRSYRYIYPFPGDVTARFAYYHEFDFPGGRDPRADAAALIEAVEEWQTRDGHYAFTAFDREDGVLLLTDTRPCATRFQRRLSGFERELYLECDTARSLAALCEHFPEHPPESMRTVLEEWVDAAMMVHVDRCYFSLATVR